MLKKLEALAIFPLAIFGLLQGKALRPFLTEITGLSPVRIGQGNLDKIGRSTIEKVEGNAKAWTYEQAKKMGWSSDECSAQIAATPKKRDGNVGVWASWIKSMEIPGAMHFPLTIALALKTDELLQSLIDACNQDDFDRFKRDICAHQEGNSPANQFDSAKPATEPLLEDAQWAAISNWSEADTVLNSRYESIFFDIYTGLDIEWGSQYFRAMKAIPLFLWIAPRINEEWDIQLGPAPSKNRIYRPIRRLLELSYALVHMHYRKCWPSAPVGRSELGKALELSDAVVGNYFDGTRKLTLRTHEIHWQAMCGHLSSDQVKPGNAPWSPTPLAVMAIVWQANLIVDTSENKLKSWILLDEDEYMRRWQYHRRNWASLLPPAGDMEWPTWLLNQSVSSDSVRSSQSSGLSSSPRE